MEITDFEFVSHPLIFKSPAKTSRDTLLSKPSWFIKLTDRNGRVGYGECSIIEGLSPETTTEIEKQLQQFKNHPASIFSFDSNSPAISFAIEMALLNLQKENAFSFFESSFTEGRKSIPINGLVWMGDKEFMKAQLKEKLEAGFNLVKLKIGGIRFEDELDLLQSIRKEYSPKEIEIRLDANGAFTPEEALNKIQKLSEFHIHSIEQPIKPLQLEDMARLCKSTPIPIALDEELIGRKSKSEKEDIIATVSPHYIILKPSLVGGLSESDEWIDIAKNNGVNWWATSALESNIGLAAIAQWVSTKDEILPQGLGTGGLYLNNIDSPMLISKGHLRMSDLPWDIKTFSDLWQG